MATMVDQKLSWPEFLAEMNRPDSSLEMHWPNFFAVGPHKTGSSSLYVHLKRHPEVFLASQRRSKMLQPEDPQSADPEMCRSLYAGAEGYRAIGEVCADYFADPNAPARIREVSPAARIIIVLRDPVERAYSHYANVRYTNPKGATAEPAESFREVLRRYENRSDSKWFLSQLYIEHSLYYAGVRRYLDTFGSDQVQILLFDHLTKNPKDVMTRIARHIGVDPGFFDKLDVSEDGHPFRMPRFPGIRWAQTHGIAKRMPVSLKTAVQPFLFNYRKPPLDEESRRLLQKLYEPDITRLEELLGRKFPELRKSWI